MKINTCKNLVNALVTTNYPSCYNSYPKFYFWVDRGAHEVTIINQSLKKLFSKFPQWYRTNTLLIFHHTSSTQCLSWKMQSKKYLNLQIYFVRISVHILQHKLSIQHKLAMSLLLSKHLVYWSSLQLSLMVSLISLQLQSVLIQDFY